MTYTISKQTLYTLFPKADQEALYKSLSAIFSDEKYAINTKERVAMFLAQYGHETGGFTKLSENLNYTSPERILVIFKKYFKTLDEAKRVAGKPEGLANIVYANRYGNGNAASGHGYKYRGRGYPHLTFLDNYRACAEAIGIDIVKSPDLVATHEVGAVVGAWFWKTNKLNDFADKGDVVGATKKINGGTNGLEEREALYKRAMKLL